MGWLDRLLRRRAAAPTPYSLDDDGLEVVLEAFDAARADSEILAAAAEGGLDVEQRLLVRHRLLLPDEAAVQRAAVLLAQDGYGTRAQQGADGCWHTTAYRTQVLTGMSAAQERSRMAGLAQRLGGDARGYDALAPRSG